MYSAIIQQEKGNLSKSTPSECKTNVFCGKPHQGEGWGTLTHNPLANIGLLIQAILQEGMLCRIGGKSFTIVTTRVRIDIYI